MSYSPGISDPIHLISTRSAYGETETAPGTAEMTIRTVINRFGMLSDADRSCVLGMLSEPNAEQMTTKGSAHDAFYVALEGMGWAEPAKLPEQLESLGLFAAWTFTPEGRSQFPALLAGAEINRHEESYQRRRPLVLAVMALKFAAGYGLIHAGAFLAVYQLTRVGVPLAPIQDLLSVALIGASIAAGVYSAVTPWMRGTAQADDLQAIVALKFVASNRWLLCASFAPLVFAFHAVLENFIVRFDPAQAARLVGNPMTRAAVMTALVCGGSWWMLPNIVTAKIRRHLDL